jgi:hypothetical protein
VPALTRSDARARRSLRPSGIHDDARPRHHSGPTQPARWTTPRTDHSICVSKVDSHGRHERGDGESSEYEQAHGCLFCVGLKPVLRRQPGGMAEKWTVRPRLARTPKKQRTMRSMLPRLGNRPTPNVKTPAGSVFFVRCAPGGGTTPKRPCREKLHRNSTTQEHGEFAISSRRNSPYETTPTPPLPGGPAVGWRPRGRRGR